MEGQFLFLVFKPQEAARTDQNSERSCQLSHLGQFFPLPVQVDGCCWLCAMSWWNEWVWKEWNLLCWPSEHHGLRNLRRLHLELFPRCIPQSTGEMQLQELTFSEYSVLGWTMSDLLLLFWPYIFYKVETWETRPLYVAIVWSCLYRST